MDLQDISYQTAIQGSRTRVLDTTTVEVGDREVEGAEAAPVVGVTIQGEMELL